MYAKKVDFRRTLRLFLKGFIPVSLLIAGFGFWYVHEQKAILMEHYQVEASHHVEGQMGRVLRFYKQAIAVLLALSRDKALDSALAGDVDARRGMANAFGDIMNISELYSQVRLLDTVGQEVVRVNRQNSGVHIVPRGQLQNKGRRAYVRQVLALSKGSVYVSPFDLNIEGGVIERPYKAVLRFATPLVDANGVTKGLLVINMLGMGVFQSEMHETVLKEEHMLLNGGSSCWFDNHLQQLSVLKDMNALIQAHHFPKDWLNAIKKKNGHIVNSEGLFTFEVVDSPLVDSTVKIHGFRQWEIISFVSASEMKLALDRIVSMVLEFSLIAIALLAVSLWFWAQYGVLKLIANQQRESLHVEHRRLLHGLIEAREDERLNLARALHDEIAQDLVAIKMQADLIASECPEEERFSLHRGVQLIRKTSERLITVVRKQLNELRPARLETLGLKSALEVMCSSLDAGGGMCCRIQIDDDVDTLTDIMKLNIYRIVQEALRNIERYADASNVVVSLTIEENMVNLLVEDDGVGFDVDMVTNGLGLVGMRERCALLRGRLEVDSESGHGTCLRMHVPACFSDA